MGSREKETFSIGKLAVRAKVKPTAIRYYEKIGLLPIPPRTRARYRLYSAVAVRRLRFIRKAIGLGLQLGEIENILTQTDQGTCPCGQVQTIFRKHINEAHKKIRSYEKMMTRLTLAMKTPYPSWRLDNPDHLLCPLVDKQRIYHLQREAGPYPKTASKQKRRIKFRRFNSASERRNGR